MAKEHEFFIENFLNMDSTKAYMGSELKAILQKKYPLLTDNNCRKIIHDTVKNKRCNSSYPLVFEKNQYAYFSVKSVFDYKLFAENIKKYKLPLHRVIYALERNKGILAVEEAQKISGATLQENTHNISFESIIKDLVLLEMATYENHNGIEYLIQNKTEKTWEDIRLYEEDLENRSLLLSLIMNWLKQTNIIDEKQLCYVGRANQYEGIKRNNEIWDAWGFSNAAGVTVDGKKYDTMVMIDYLPQHEYQGYDFLGFKERIDRVVFSTKVSKRKVLPIILSSRISPVAKLRAKENEYLYFNILSILGENSLDVVKTFNSSVDEIERNVQEKNYNFQDKISNSLRAINKTGHDGNYGYLKGVLFEYLMLPVLQKIYGQNAIITHGYKGKIEGKEFECDYLIETETENIIVELKGYKKGGLILKGAYDKTLNSYPKNTVMWFLDHTFCLCDKQLGHRKNNKICYITTADLDTDAKNELVARKKNKPEKMECFYTYKSLLDLLSEFECKDEKKIINVFYV